MQTLDPNTIQNKRKYHLHIDLEAEYEPLQKKNRDITFTRVQKDNIRCSGKKNIDLWCDGSIYPIDPTTVSTPNFRNVTSLLKFVGDGSNGLLGYCNHLVADSYQVSNLNRSLVVQNAHLLEQQQLCMEKVTSSKVTIEELEKQVKKTRIKNTALGWRQRCKTISNIETLKVGSGGLKKRIRAVR